MGQLLSQYQTSGKNKNLLKKVKNKKDAQIKCLDSITGALSEYIACYSQKRIYCMPSP
jgi:hypothetical protein